MPVYSKCSNCGHEFVSHGYGITGHVAMGNNLESCPRCGSLAQAMEGEFNIGPGSEGRVEVLSGPQWSRDLIERMQGTFREIDKIAGSKRLSDDEARALVSDLLNEVRRSNPRVAEEFERVAGGHADAPERKRWSWAARAVVAAFTGIGVLNTLADFTQRVIEAFEFFASRG